MDSYIIFILCVAVLLVIKIYIKFTTGWCKSNVCLVGKTAIVTGANVGIGYETAEDFAKRGAKVILACRDSNKGNAAAESIIKQTDNSNVFFKHLDLSSFKSIRRFAEEINKLEDRLDILVNNAGASMIGPEKSEDNILLLMQVNYLGPFLLTNLLLGKLKNTPNSRIVNVSSFLAQFSLNLDVDELNQFPKNILMKHLILYSRSKLCQIIFTIELAKLLRGTSVTTYSLHPGLSPTAIYQGFFPGIRELWFFIVHLFLKDNVECAQTTIYCSVAKGIEHHSGEFFQDCQVLPRYRRARNADLPKKLWAISEKLVQLS